MSDLHKILDVSQLNNVQKAQYDKATTDAYPALVLCSEVIKNHWDKLETYFSSYQVVILNRENELVGFINAVPLFWDRPLAELPEEGWDWLLMKAIHDYENNIQPNCLGGIQINILKRYQGKGYSKSLIAIGKERMEKANFKNYILPIRPTLKWKYPEMKMEEYMHFKLEGKIYDPWIRVHLNEGAKIIKVCSNSMNVAGDIDFWEHLFQRKFDKPEAVIVAGALNEVLIDPERNFGEYREENIWIYYSISNLAGQLLLKQGRKKHP